MKTLLFKYRLFMASAIECVWIEHSLVKLQTISGNIYQEVLKSDEEALNRFNNIKSHLSHE